MRVGNGLLLPLKKLNPVVIFSNPPPGQHSSPFKLLEFEFIQFRLGSFQTFLACRKPPDFRRQRSCYLTPGTSGNLGWVAHFPPASMHATHTVDTPASR